MPFTCQGKKTYHTSVFWPTDYRGEHRHLPVPIASRTRETHSCIGLANKQKILRPNWVANITGAGKKEKYFHFFLVRSAHKNRKRQLIKEGVRRRLLEAKFLSTLSGTGKNKKSKQLTRRMAIVLNSQDFLFSALRQLIYIISCNFDE